jgi:hypothetical protein
MGSWVLRVSILVLVVAAGGMGLGATSHDAEASPPSTVFTSITTPPPIEEAGWRRQWRRQGPPVVVVPDTGVAVDTDVEIDIDEAAPAAVIVLPPPRPRSCGQYRYWNGDRCVDARYNDPYLGPR